MTGVRVPGRGGLVHRLASLRLTLVVMLALAALVVAVYRDPDVDSAWLALPLAVLALNLLAAMASNALFRRQTALLGFHLALLAIVLLAALGRMTYFKGRAEITEGTAFDGRPDVVARGPWHRDRLADLAFENVRFAIDYTPRVTIARTRNDVRWRDDAGRWQAAQISEQVPVVLRGYRFYVTGQKGFAPVFSWRGRDGREITGSIHLPRFPSDRFEQVNEWPVPGAGRNLWLQLVLDAPLLVEGQVSTLRPPAVHRLVVRDGAVRAELRPGDRLELPEGVLTYRELRLWMGYLIFYDWTVPWLLAAALVAVGCLGAHFWQRHLARPWDPDAAPSNPAAPAGATDARA